MRKNTVEPDKPHMAIQRMRIACWVPKATNRHSEYVMLFFQSNNICTNAPQCYVSEFYIRGSAHRESN